MSQEVQDSTQVLNELASQFCRAQGKASQIRISPSLDRQLSKVFVDLGKDQTLPQVSIEKIVQALEHDRQSLYERCTSRTIIVLFSILRHSESCQAIARGLHLLAEWLSRDGSAKLRRRKVELGEEILDQTVEDLCSSNVNDHVRLCMGSLSLCILENIDHEPHARLVREKHGKSLCHIYLQDANPMLRLISGMIICVATTKERHGRIFRSREWNQTVEEAMSSFPEEFGRASNHQSLQDKPGSRKFKPAEPVQCAAVDIPELDLHCDSDSADAIFASVGEDSMILITHSRQMPTNIIRIPFAAMKNISIEHSRQDPDTSTSSTFTVVIHLHQHEQSKICMDGADRDCSLVYFEPSHPTFAFYLHRQVEAKIADHAIAPVTNARISGQNDVLERQTAETLPSSHDAASPGECQQSNPRLPSGIRDKRKLDIVAQTESKKAKHTLDTTQPINGRVAHSSFISRSQESGNETTTPNPPSASTLTEIPHTFRPRESHSPGGAEGLMEGTSRVHAGKRAHVASTTSPRKVPGNGALAHTSCDSKAISAKHSVYHESDAPPSELRLSVAQEHGGIETQNDDPSSSDQDTEDMAPNATPDRPAEDKHSQTHLLKDLKEIRTPSEQLGRRSSLAFVDHDGSPIPSLSSQLRRGLDAGTLISAGLETAEVDALRTPEKPYFGYRSLGSFRRLRQGGTKSPPQSTQAALLSSSTGRSSSKPIPSSPNAPSRMLQDMVYHRETADGFVNLEGGETIKPVDLYDPFCSAEPSKRLLATRTSEDRHRQASWPKFDTAISATHEDNEAAATLSDCDVSDTLTQESDTLMSHGPVPNTTTLEERTNHLSDLDRVKSLMNRQLESLISAGHDVESIINDYEDKSEGLVALLDRATACDRDVDTVMHLRAARNEQANALLHALKDIEDGRRAFVGHDKESWD